MSLCHDPRWMMATEQKLDERDKQLLGMIKRGPGQYPTPSPDRVQRLIDKGLVKKERGTLRLTLKGRIVSWFER